MMKNRFIHILILLLVFFQNAWAMEQTYRSVCDSIESSHETSIELEHEIELVAQDINSPTEHQHQCNHMGTPLIGLIQIIDETNIDLNHYYPEIPSKHLHSITNKPAIPPPIV